MILCSDKSWRSLSRRWKPTAPGFFVAQQIARHYREEYRSLFGEDPATVLGASYPQLSAERTGCQLELTFFTTPDEECSGGELHGVPGDGAEYDGLSLEQQETVTRIALNMGKAIAAYERQLSCGKSRFDDFMHGNPRALSTAEKRGAALFVGKAKCVDCHSGPFLSDQSFHNVGLIPARVAVAFLDKDDPGAAAGLAQLLLDPLNVAGKFSDGDDGRIPGEIKEEMLGAFRTPALRCVSGRPSFMHTGQLTTLEDVVGFFNDGGHVGPGETEVPDYLGQSEISPLGLSAQEVRDLVAFLRSLDSISGPDPALLVDPFRQ